jgi:hypothetical protein
MLAVPKLRVCTQRAKERLLERIFGAVAAEPPDEKAEDLLAVLLVELFERRRAHASF